MCPRPELTYLLTYLLTYVLICPQPEGFIGHTCKVTVDLGAKTLTFQIDDEEPVSIPVLFV